MRTPCVVITSPLSPLGKHMPMGKLKKKAFVRLIQKQLCHVGQ